MKKRRIQDFEIFSQTHYKDIQSRIDANPHLHALRSLNKQIVEEESEVPNIEERNKEIARTYKEYKSRKIVGTSQKLFKRTKCALDLSTLRKRIINENKVKAINRHFEIKIQAVISRMEQGAKELTIIQWFVWIRVIEFYKVLRLIKMRIFLAKQLKLLHNRKVKATLLLQQGFRNFLLTIPETATKRKIFDVKRVFQAIGHLTYDAANRHAKAAIGKAFLSFTRSTKRLEQFFSYYEKSNSDA